MLRLRRNDRGDVLNRRQLLRLGALAAAAPKAAVAPVGAVVSTLPRELGARLRAVQRLMELGCIPPTVALCLLDLPGP